MKSSTDSISSRCTEEWSVRSPLANLCSVAGAVAWGVLLLAAGLFVAGCDSNGSPTQEPPVDRDATVRLAVENQTPTARDSVKFIYSIFLPDAAADSATLDFGDGESIKVALGDYQNVYHAYRNDGEYTATLSVENGSGSEMQESVEVAVQPEEPTASLSVDAEKVETGQEVTFTYSIIDPDTVISSAVLEFDDGASVPVQAGEDRTVTHTYSDVIGEMQPRIVINGEVAATASIIVSSSRVIDVEAGTGTIASALQEARRGTTIRLVTDGGVYKEATLVIDKNITIKAKDGLDERPTIVYDEASYSGSPTQIQIVNPTTRVRFENFVMGRPAGDGTAQPNVMVNHAADAARLNLYMHGMELRNVSNKLLANANDEDPAVYDSLVVTQSYGHHSGNNFFDLKSHNAPNDATITANYVRFENVTIAQTPNMGKAIGFMTKGGKNSTDVMELRFNHVTMDQIKIGMNINRTPVDCGISEIKNTIITRTQSGNKPAIRWNGLCKIEVSHMVTSQTGGFGGGNISSASSLEWDELHYRDPSSGDYGLQSGAPGTAGNQPASDGDDRGDLAGFDEDARVSNDLTIFWR